MHYKNGRKAKVGDLVIGMTYNRPGVQVGVVKSISQGQETCNCTLILPTLLHPLPPIIEYTQLDYLLHVEDAYHFVIGVAFSPLDQDYMAKIMNFSKWNAPIKELPPHERPVIRPAPAK